MDEPSTAEAEATEEAPKGRSSRRSVGQQARSRERVDQLLDAAEALVTAQGFDGLKMRELARSAGLPIASIYHYFPSNVAVLRALAEKHLAELQAVIASSMERHMEADIKADDAPEAVGRVVMDVAIYLSSRTATATIWDALRAVPELRALDMEDTAANARFIAPYMARIAGTMTPDEMQDFCLILIEALQSNLMVIMHAPPERQPALMQSLARFATVTVRGLQLSNR
ncbi:TetR/AcrR family transcriptional regulator [Rhizobium sp. C4]|uniref:TetR/AcrR family transcriptional regulator n=1 Tax=Rhizobium sp. C4 TaxID=1349800 RepID=UPI001E4E41AB|nr:TetR/AcrR family transcriptional regulator [Rhizobium sp. C4]MCD2174301.1 TetR/AcrR family transcriptional regulator [Rhizobium sp. C4]